MDNIVLITLDDVSFFNLGFTEYFENVTPRINEMSKSAYVFCNAHCNIPFCQPSRMVLLTGLYPQNNGSTEFNIMRPKTITLPSLLKSAGYSTSIVGKLEHHLPDSCFDWDRKDIGMGIGFDSNYESGKKSLIEFFEQATHPHFSLVNIAVTHRPFESSNARYEGRLPNFLPDTDLIRRHISNFFASLKRADDIVGDILDRTSPDDWVLITSDHGFSFPYVKGNCYGFSTSVPLIIRHKSIAPFVDRKNCVSHVDFVPTIAEAFGLSGQFDGFSYLDCLKDQTVSNKHQFVYSQLNKMFSGPPCRIRAISSITHTFCLNFDDHYPADCVDGWGYNDLLGELGDICKRPIKEFIRYQEMDYWSCEDKNLEHCLGIELIRRMKKYRDPISSFFLI